MIDQNKALLTVKHLKQYFNVGQKNEVKAVDDINFEIYEGETFGLVGESGSGKTTTGRAVMHLYKPTSGEIIFEGTPEEMAEKCKRGATAPFVQKALNSHL